MTLKLTGMASKVGLLWRLKIKWIGLQKKTKQKNNNNNKLLKRQSAWQIKMLVILLQEQGLNKGYYVTLLSYLLHVLHLYYFVWYSKAGKLSFVKGIKATSFSSNKVFEQQVSHMFIFNRTELILFLFHLNLRAHVSSWNPLYS